jgi:hypothetical protein
MIPGDAITMVVQPRFSAADMPARAPNRVRHQFSSWAHQYGWHLFGLPANYDGTSRV